MSEIVAIVLDWVLTTTACFFVVIRDERALDPALRERAWPPVSRDAAIIAFGQIALLVHFWKTRRWGIKGFALGVAWMVGVSLPALATNFVLGLIFPELQ